MSHQLASFVYHPQLDAMHMRAFNGISITGKRGHQKAIVVIIGIRGREGYELQFGFYFGLKCQKLPSARG